jgi:hypothetical protein
MLESVVLAHVHHGTLYLNLKKIKFQSFKIFHKEYMDGANYIHYHRAKLLYKITCILSLIKIKKSIYVAFFLLPKFLQFIFFPSLHYKIFHIKNLQDYIIYN